MVNLLLNFRVYVNVGIRESLWHSFIAFDNVCSHPCTLITYEKKSLPAFVGEHCHIPSVPVPM